MLYGNLTSGYSKYCFLGFVPVGFFVFVLGGNVVVCVQRAFPLLSLPSQAQGGEPERWHPSGCGFSHCPVGGGQTSPTCSGPRVPLRLWYDRYSM